MINPDRTMPDFSDTLEDRLLRISDELEASRAQPRMTAVTRGRRMRPLAVASTVAVVVVIAGVATVVSAGPGAQTAYGKPLILSAPTVDASRFGGGLEAMTALGPGARFDKAREIPTSAGPAYLVSGDKGWCLTVPDPASKNPSEERGVTCATPAAFDRIGLSIDIGGTYLAAIPQGVKNPTLESDGSPARELVPSDLGVVSATVTSKSEITLYGTDGGKRTDEILPGK